VVCVSLCGDAMVEGLAVAAGLIEDGDADEALVVVADQSPDRAAAVLVGAA
jgi:3-oxoacyl-[acyl-carrier-protein] synthase III